MVQIRVATVADAASIREIYAYYIQETTITFHTVVESNEAYREQIQTTLQKYPWYVAEADDGTLLGYAYASEYHPRQAYRWSVGISIYLKRDAHQQGIGRRLYAKVLETLRQQGFRMVHAGITMPNEASRRLHESLGFRHVGTFPASGYKLGDWKDVGWWVLDLMDGKPSCGPQPEPIPFAQLAAEQRPECDSTGLQ